MKGTQVYKSHILRMCLPSPKKLSAVADVVLAYRPKSKQPKPRKRKKAKKKTSEKNR